MSNNNDRSPTEESTWSYIAANNKRLTCLLAEACYMIGSHRMLFVSQELEQWYEEHKKQEEL